MPGVHLREVQRLTGTSFSSTRYHVERLEESGEIVREEDGGYSRLFPSGTTSDEKVIFSLLRGDTNRKIIVCLSQHSSLSNKQLADLTRLAKSTISQRLAQLTRAGMVEIKHSEDGVTRYQLNKPDFIESLMRSKRSSFLAKGTDRFIDLWDF
jgi:predicted transcriptional regulator